MTREPMPDETDHIATEAAALDDPYAALSQHLHGDGGAPDGCATPGCTNRPLIRLDDRRLCLDCYATHDFGDNA